MHIDFLLLHFIKYYLPNSSQIDNILLKPLMLVLRNVTLSAYHEFPMYMTSFSRFFGWGSNADIWVQMTIWLIYCRSIVRFTKGSELLFITFLLQFFLTQMSSRSISNIPTHSSTFSTIYIYRYIYYMYR